jgi:hypothetical protein
MRPRVRAYALAAMAFSLLAFTAQRSYAGCDPTGADMTDVAHAREMVNTNCPCGPTNHGQYVKCAGEQAKMFLTNQSCKGVVVKCAAKSTCGKPNFVTCCRTNSMGVTKCSTKSNATHCTPPMGGKACVSTKSSCCDACTSSGCASPSGAFLDATF